MKYSKTGLEMRLIRALIYLMAAIGGYVPILLLAGYVYLYDNDEILKEDILKCFL